MKKFAGIFLATFLLLGAAFGQSLSEGSVVSVQALPNPENKSVVYDFELCCGYPSGAGGYLGNGFAYVDGAFTLYFKAAGEPIGYKVEGTINEWYEPQAISKYCTVQSATLKNVEVILSTGTLVEGDVAEYSQMFCQRDGVYWLAGGGLTVHGT